jgi:hypothetical protein
MDLYDLPKEMLIEIIINIQAMEKKNYEEKLKELKSRICRNCGEKYHCQNDFSFETFCTELCKKSFFM